MTQGIPRFVSGVGTNFVGLIIASAYQAGIRDYDVELAFKAAYKNETKYKNRIEGAGKTDLKGFVENGYVPHLDKFGFTSPQGSGFSASHTLEYSYSSYAVAQFAKALGKKEKYEELMELSDNWKNLYDEKNRFHVFIIILFNLFVFSILRFFDRNGCKNTLARIAGMFFILFFKQF